MAAGFFITFEGIEGSGKSTQIRKLKTAAEAAGFRARVTREPGGSAVAERIRELLLHPPPDHMPSDHMPPLSEALLHYAARLDHLEKVILPALAAGDWVLCDRFADSTMAYQGFGLGLGAEAVGALHQLAVGAVAPDLTLILDLPAHIGLDRAQSRTANADHYEQLAQPFHQRVRDAFLQIASRDPDRCVVIDGLQPPAAVAAQVRDAVNKRFGVNI